MSEFGVHGCAYDADRQGNFDHSVTVIVGAGGHGREMLGVVRRVQNPVFAGFIDDNPPGPAILQRISANVICSVAEAGALVGVSYLIGIGSGQVRASVAKRLPESWNPGVAVDPSAVLNDDVRLSPGCVIFAQTTLTTNIQLGVHSHIGRGVAIGHDCEIGDHVSVLPLAAVSGSVKIGNGATIGTGAVVRQGLSIGENAFVGAGAVVVKDVPENAIVVGNPARQIRR